MKIKVIGEIGVNHGGNFVAGVNLVNQIAEAGADIIKLQLFHRTEVPDEQKYLALTKGEYEALASRIKATGKQLAITAFTPETVTYAATLKPDYLKVASPDLSNRPLLRAVAHTGIPAILSTGGHTTADAIERIAEFISMPGASFEAAMYCKSTYPTRLYDYDLSKMLSLMKFCNTGFSGHSNSNDIYKIAATAGARWIEAHIKSKTSSGPDISSSISVKQLTHLIAYTRLIEHLFTPKPIQDEVQPNVVG